MINKEMFNKENLENAQDKLGKVAKDLGKQTKNFVNNKEEDLKNLANACCEHVKENPISSVLIGFAAGVVLTKLFDKIAK